ncbi:MAG: hypothetical protein JSS45_11935 [Proteobacteria bacterium]|nr:hypothetical protein [Pseudomonadota bacterium]
MARIPDHEVERLKAEVSLQRLMEAKGVQLVKHGKDWLGRCPFHDDRTPSLVVSPGKNLWHCLGACATGGTVIDWVMRAEGVSFRHAVELLRADAPLSGHVVKQATVPKLAAPVTMEADDASALAQVIDYYHATLKQSPEALAYLKSGTKDTQCASAKSHNVVTRGGKLNCVTNIACEPDGGPSRRTYGNGLVRANTYDLDCVFR